MQDTSQKIAPLNWTISRHGFSRNRTVLIQTLMRAGMIELVDIRRQHPVKMPVVATSLIHFKHTPDEARRCSKPCQAPNFRFITHHACSHADLLHTASPVSATSIIRSRCGPLRVITPPVGTRDEDRPELGRRLLCELCQQVDQRSR